MPIDNAIVNAIILEQLGELPAELEPIEMGVMTFKYKLKVKGSYYILRVYPPANTTRTDIEFGIMHNLYGMGCKVPQPVKFNNGEGIHWLLYKFIEGQPLSVLLPDLAAAEVDRIAAQILDNMLHFIKEPVKGFGFLLISEGTFNSWKDFLQESVNRGSLYLTQIKELDQPAIDMLLAFAKKQIEHIDFNQPCLVWSDFSPGNIIIHKKELAGFVDFEGCVSGDPLMALGYLFAIEGHSDFFESMLAQFQQQFSVTYQQIIFYTVIRLFRLSKYFNLAFPTGINRDPLMMYFKGVPVAVEYVKSL